MVNFGLSAVKPSGGNCDEPVTNWSNLKWKTGNNVGLGHMRMEKISTPCSLLLVIVGDCGPEP